MKKILMAATAALCFASGSFAQENAGGDSAFTTALGSVNKPIIVAGAAGLAVLGGVVANNRGTAKLVPVVPPVVPPVEPPVECGAGEELVDGECVPSSPTTTVTSTVTATNTVTSTATTPVTVTVTATTL